MFFFVNSNDAICLDIVKGSEALHTTSKGVAVNFLITDGPEPVSFLVPEIVRALLKIKCKHDNTPRD